MPIETPTIPGLLAYDGRYDGQETHPFWPRIGYPIGNPGYMHMCAVCGLNRDGSDLYGNASRGNPHRNGIAGWPLTVLVFEHHPRQAGEVALTCPQCFGMHVTTSVRSAGYGMTGPNRTYRMGDPSVSTARCESCLHEE